MELEESHRSVLARIFFAFTVAVSESCVILLICVILIKI